MKVEAMRDLTSEELRHQYEDTAQELFNLRVQQAGGQLEKPSRIRALRREVARLRTVENERKKAGVK